MQKVATTKKTRQGLKLAAHLVLAIRSLCLCPKVLRIIVSFHTRMLAGLLSFLQFSLQSLIHLSVVLGQATYVQEKAVLRS